MTIQLSAAKRGIIGKKVFKLRQADKIPAVVYGHGLESNNIELNYNDFEKVFNEAGESTIIDLTINGDQPIKVLISDMQFDPIKHRINHVDLHQIKMDEELHAHVELKFIGESKMVKEEGGSLIHNLSELEIKCLPKDLIHEIEVDVSRLENFDDVITINDLKLPDTIEVVGHEGDDVVALVVRHKEEKEEPVATPEVATTEAASAPTEEGAKEKTE